jgi:hypothetical protein
VAKGAGLPETGIGWNAIGRAYQLSQRTLGESTPGEDKAKVYYAGMDEGRKRVIGVMAPCESAHADDLFFSMKKLDIFTNCPQTS